MKPVTRNLVKTMKNLTKEEVYTLGKTIKCVEKHAPQEFSGRLDAEHRKNLLTAYAELEKETVPRYLFDVLKNHLGEPPSKDISLLAVPQTGVAYIHINIFYCRHSGKSKALKFLHRADCYPVQK